VQNNPIKFNDPTGHSGDFPCWYCNITWLDYSHIVGAWNSTIDAVANLGCFVAGCHVDSNEDKVTGPTKEEALNAAVLGMVNPLGSPATKLASNFQNVSDDVMYAGVRKASKFLQDIGVPRDVRKQAIEAFDILSIKLRRVGDFEYGIRYYDNITSKAKSGFLFDTFPGSREELAIQFKWNKMTMFKQWQIRPGTIIVEGITAKQGPYLRGGRRQMYVPKFKIDLLEIFE
jgi:hypothetical protein